MSHVGFQGCTIFPANLFVLFSGFGTKTRLECPDIHGRYIPAMLGTGNETKSHTAKVTDTPQAEKTDETVSCMLSLFVACLALLPAKEKVICDFPLEICIKTHPYWLNPGWVIQENRGETYLSCIKKWQLNQCEAVDGGIA